MDKYINRLLDEWNKYGKVILAVDYDDTLSPWGFDADDEVIKRTIKLLKEVKITGAYIVIWTACSTDRFNEIKTYCDSIGVEIDGINVNPIELPYGNNGKIYANVFLDDRGGINEALDILETAMYMRRGAKEIIRNYPGVLG